MTHRFSNHASKSSLLAVVDIVAKALTTTAARAQLRTKVITVAVLIVLSISLIACGGGGKSSTPTSSVSSVSINSSPTSVLTNGTLTFTATVTVTGSASQAVTWSATRGKITSAGVYTAPATAGNDTVTATSVADPTKSFTVTVTVTAVVVSVTAPLGPFYATKAYQFEATINGVLSTAVTWSVQGGNANGTVSAAGLYTAPATAGTYTVIATSTADTTKSGSAAIAVTIPAPTFSGTPLATLAQTTATYTYPVAATDPAGTTIFYSLTTFPTGALINSSTGELTWTPALSARVMPSSFTVKATTGIGGTATETWTVTPYRQVVMTLIDKFWNSGVTQSLPLSSAITPVAAIVPGSPTATTITATASSDFSTYTMNNVPAGYFWLVDGPTEKFWTNTNSFDAGTDYVGNLISSPTVATPVTFDLVGTFSAADAIWVGSPNTNSWFAPQNPLVSPFVDAPTPESIAANTIPMIVSGDPSYVLQFSSQSFTDGNYSGMSIVDDVSLGTAFTYSIPIVGTLASTTSSTLDLTTSGWGAMLPAAEYGTPAVDFFATYLSVLPYTTPPSAAFGGGFPSCIMGGTGVSCASEYITTLAGWPATSAYPQPAVINDSAQNTREAAEDAGPLYMAWAERCAGESGSSCEPPDAGPVTLAFDNPFTSTTWPYVLTSQEEVKVQFGTFGSYALQNTSAVEFTATTLPSTYTISPVVNPVTAPLINGADMFTAASFPAPLTLSWTAGAANSGAKPTGYHIIVYLVSASGWSGSIANLYTTNTSVTLPTLGLSAGTYAFVIEARADATSDLTASPYRSSYPKGTAQIVSAPITITGAW